MTVATEHRYVVRDDTILGGEPIVVGPRASVRAIVELWRLGVAPEEVPTHLPHLTPAQVFDAWNMLDPLGCVVTTRKALARRRRNLDGVVIGVLDNSKPNRRVLLERVADDLRERGVPDVRAGRGDRGGASLSPP